MIRRLHILCLLFCIGLWLTEVQGKNKSINIWQGSDVKKCVALTPFLASGTGNIAVVVCPGGSYFWHDMNGEGMAVGQWLQQNGVSAFVLHYRTAGFMA